MDAVMLSRIQFAFTSMFHYIYPPLSIGLGVVLVIMEGIYIKTKNPLYKEMAKFWAGIFSLTFALGVATGLVQVFGFGTNWASYSRFVGDVFGSALGAEGVFAFFLESGFLGLMLFGWNRVSAKMHYFATWMVALGAHFSSIWIVVANSWMQTPAGHKIVGEGPDARAVITNFWEMVFNPSFLDRITHVVLGCWLCGIFLVLSISAYYFLKNKHIEFAKASMKIGLILSSVVLVLQLFSAHSTARGVAVNQPTKLAAMEGIFDTETHAPLSLLGWVDVKNQTMHGIKIPSLLSLLAFGKADAPVMGLNEVPVDERPPVQVVYQAYHTMIWMWGLMALVTVAAIFFWIRNNFQSAKWTLRALVISVMFPMVANQVGWMTAEIGRQPWIVYKILKTPAGVSKSIVAAEVAWSLTMLFLIYSMLLVLFLYLLDRKIKHGPVAEGARPSDTAEVYRNPTR
ncbi:MAG: cytochrome ubiquinol oxidase subunit I [Chlamydiae bacterium CG10_big_fil_rev_8_21_14_0_10_42_34]|nr:MAG: cytochrome ubiquinol oxidase subunit I [Chlamydiae bacterium CG10_big_fil_rev_8_21_14_0_10_42_34]